MHPVTAKASLLTTNCLENPVPALFKYLNEVPVAQEWPHPQKEKLIMGELGF